MAATELIRKYDSVARAFVKANGIPAICDVLAMPVGVKDFKLDLLIALQRLLDVKMTNSVCVLHLIGTNLARVMME